MSTDPADSSISGSLGSRVISDIFQRCVKHKNGSCAACHRLSELTDTLDTTPNDQLLRQRDQLIAMLNKHHDPFVHLPSEISSHILSCCKSSAPGTPEARYDDELLIRSIMTPSQVCRAWREIAFGTPGLWTTFCLTISPSKCRVSVDISRTWLSKSGALPLKIQLTIHPQFNEDHMRYVQQIFLQISRCSERWEALDLKIQSSSLDWVSPLLSELDLHRLTHLKVAIEGAYEGELSLKAAPELLVGCDNRLTIDFSRLTQVFVDYICDEDFVWLLQHAPLLSSATIHATSGDDEDPLTVLKSTSLRSLTIENVHNEFWNHFEFPSLETLRISYLQNGYENIHNLVHRSGCMITDMSLTDLGDDHEGVVELLKLNPVLERLSLNDDVLNKPLFQYLNEVLSTTKFLKKLKSLTCKTKSFYFDWVGLEELLVLIMSRQDSERSLVSLTIRFPAPPVGPGGLVPLDIFEKVMSFSSALQVKVVDLIDRDITGEIRAVPVAYKSRPDTGRSAIPRNM